MKKIYISILLLINIVIANECTLDNKLDLLNINYTDFKILDKTFLLKSEKDEQLKFYYKKDNKLLLVKYRGFSSASSLEIDYYFGENHNILVNMVRTNYTDFIGSKVVNTFSTQVIKFPLCGNKIFNKYNYNGLKKEYELAWRIRELGNF